ncbi:MAG: hypothetical protein LH615_09705, partial [Ferruginibacter sp.]|nr:hypothetical protein [Ferruginibacter sp.]
ETQYTKKIPNYTYNLLKVGKDNEKTITINVENNIIHKMTLHIEPGNKIFVSGLLKKTCMANIHALFYGYLNTSTNTVDELKIINYGNDIIKAVEVDGWKPVKEGGAGISPFFIPIYTFKRENGAIDIGCEYTNITENTNGRIFFNEYTSGDIINANIATNGKVTLTRVPKNQYNVDHSSYLSAYTINYKNKLVLLYNDTEKNLTKEISEKPVSIERFGFRKSILMQLTIDEYGKVTRQKVDGANQDSFIVIPRSIHKNKDNLFTVKSTNENFFTYKFKLGFLELQ